MDKFSKSFINRELFDCFCWMPPFVWPPLLIREEWPLLLFEVGHWLVTADLPDPLTEFRSGFAVCGFGFIGFACPFGLPVDVGLVHRSWLGCLGWLLAGFRTSDIERPLYRSLKMRTVPPPGRCLMFSSDAILDDAFHSSFCSRIFLAPPPFKMMIQNVLEWSEWEVSDKWSWRIKKSKKIQRTTQTWPMMSIIEWADFWCRLPFQLLGDQLLFAGSRLML